MIRSSILKFESAILEDANLKNWQSTGDTIIKSQSKLVYDQYRLYPTDIARDIDWDKVTNELEMLN